MDRESLLKLYEFYLERFKDGSVAIRDLANQSLYVILGIIAVFGVIIAGILESDIPFNYKMFGVGGSLILYGLISLTIYSWSEKIVGRQYVRWLEVVSTLNKLDSLLGFADELSEDERVKLKSFKHDKYVLPDRFVEIGVDNFDDFKNVLLKCEKSNFFCDFKDLIWKFRIGSFICLFLGLITLILFFPVSDVLNFVSPENAYQEIWLT